MTRKTKSRNSDNIDLAIAVGFGVFVALPLAYLTYKTLKDRGYIDAAYNYAEPYIEEAKTEVADVYTEVKNTLEEVYTEVTNSENPVEALKEALLRAKNAEVLSVKGGVKEAAETVEKAADDVADGKV